jgi:iron complex transport system ATP-binding protein
MSEKLPPLLEFENVTVRRGVKEVLREVSLRVKVGEHVAILGPNGCGKSTLIQTLTRDLYPLAQDGARIALFGREEWNVFDLRAFLGIVSNDLMARCTRPVTGAELVLSGYFSSIGIWPNHEVTAAMRERTAALLAELEIAHLAEREVDEMSSGEARRILIARALVHDPIALVLDEPSNSLDLFAQHELRETMRKLARRGLTIVLVTHHLEDVIPEIERVVLMKQGRIVGDGRREEMLTSARLTALFGLKVEVS